MNPRRLEKGFTLLEALIAMAIVSIASSALIAAASSSTRNTARRFEILNLAASAQQRLANLAAAAPEEDSDNQEWLDEVTLVAEQEGGDGKRLYRISVESSAANDAAPRVTLITYVMR